MPGDFGYGSVLGRVWCLRWPLKFLQLGTHNIHQSHVCIVKASIPMRCYHSVPHRSFHLTVLFSSVGRSSKSYFIRGFVSYSQDLGTMDR